MNFSGLLQKTRQTAFAAGIKLALIAVESELDDSTHSRETLDVLRSIHQRIQNARLDP